MRKKIILGVLVLLVATVVTVVVLKKKNNIRDLQGQPQQTTEEILEERARQASNHIRTPLGTAFVQKNWKEFEKIYQPQKDFRELGEIIRACFIENCFKDFNKTEQSQVLTYVVKTISTMKPKEFALAGILITQFERLPSPAHDSENYRTMEGWYLNSEASDVQKRMAVLKLGVQDAEPATQWAPIIIQGLTGKTFGLSRSSWVQMVGDMRNIKNRKTVIASMIKDFNKIEKSAQPDSLVIMAQNEAKSSKVKSYFFKFLDSNNQEEFEGALKSIIPMNDEHVFNESELTKIKDRLRSFSDELRTPYADLKSKEILNVLK